MNRRLTIGLVVVFAALAVYVLVVQAPKDNAASATATVVPATYLWTVRADQINGVHIVDRVKGKAVDLVKDAGGAWSLAQPGPQPADQARAAQDVSSLMTLAVNNTITTATDLAAFGVLSPTLTVEVDLADGTKLKAAIGDKAPTGAAYYALREGEKQVVVLSSAAQGTLASLAASPPVVPPTATPTPGPGTPSVTPVSPTPVVTTTVVARTPTPTSSATATATATSTVAPTATSTATATAAATSTPTAATASQTAPVRTATPARTATKAPKSTATP
jgi:hypothetical protein